MAFAFVVPNTIRPFGVTIWVEWLGAQRRILVVVTGTSRGYPSHSFAIRMAVTNWLKCTEDMQRPMSAAPGMMDLSF